MKPNRKTIQFILLSLGVLLIFGTYIFYPKFNKTIDFAIKFQYRDSKSFIHESFIDSDDKQIERFKSTFLTRADWKKIVSFSKNKFKLVCTPFDEISVENVINDGFDYLKIASCSATDWPLLETVAKKIKRKNRKDWHKI